MKEARTKDPMMQPCRRGCGELVHLENDGFHVCRTSKQRAEVEFPCGHTVAHEEDCPRCEVERLRAFISQWTYEGNLQTFEDRARFRTDAQRILAGVAAERQPIASNEWIPLTERVPPYEVQVLTTDGTYCNVAERTRTTKHGEVFELAGQETGKDRETVSVTHWMQLPALPAVETAAPIERAVDHQPDSPIAWGDGITGTIARRISIALIFVALTCLLGGCGKMGVSGHVAQAFGNWAEIRLPPGCAPKQISAEEGSGVAVLCEDGRVFH